MPDLTELRDELARVCGYSVCEGIGRNGEDGWCRPEEPMQHHPFPPNDLNALAAVWPSDLFRLRIMHLDDGWVAFADDAGEHGGQFARYSQRYPTEYEARLRLTLAVLKEKAHA